MLSVLWLNRLRRPLRLVATLLRLAKCSVPAPADAGQGRAHCTLENAAAASACVACGAWWCPRHALREAVACCDLQIPGIRGQRRTAASPNDAVDAPVAEKAAADADAATTPSQAEPMKVLQSLWDASAVATAP